METVSKLPLSERFESSNAGRPSGQAWTLKEEEELSSQGARGLGVYIRTDCHGVEGVWWVKTRRGRPNIETWGGVQCGLFCYAFIHS